ncbi:hypothetical protein ACYOEI_41505, partial [Singulisphaera rosea]
NPAQGTVDSPFATFAPESIKTATNPTDPFGGPNDISNYTTFNANYDRNGDGKFERSAFYAAQALTARDNSPVVIIALPGILQRNPITGASQQATYVLQAPAGSNSYNDGSASVPFDTMLVMTAGTTVKLQNATLYVQNQGSSLQLLGGANPNQQVTFTSLNDTLPLGSTTTGTPVKSGDWGGIKITNFDDKGSANHLRGFTTFPVDGLLKGVNGAAAVSGAQDALTILNYANIRYAGGAISNNPTVHFDAVMLANSRPVITNTNISF